MDEEIAIVCARADAPLMIAGSTFDHKCAKCSILLMLSISGKRFLDINPNAITICPQCIRPSDVPIGPAASPSELAEELKNVKPNMRRNRN